MKATFHGIPRETATKWVQEAVAPIEATVERHLMYIHGFEIDKDRIRTVKLLDNNGTCDIEIVLNPPSTSRSYPSGFSEYHNLNEGCAFPKHVEGYWRQHKENTSDECLPWPVAFDVEGYDKIAFIGKLTLLQLSSDVKRNTYRGMSTNRLTGESNGNAEYELDGWAWPEGYIAYLALGIPPSRAFYKFVMGVDLLTLPTYGRD